MASLAEAGVALVGTHDDVRVAALLSLPAQADTDRVLRQLCGRLAGQPEPATLVIGAGSPTTAGLAEARRT